MNTAFTGGGSTFVVEGPALDRNSVNIATSLSYINKDWEFTAYYNLEARSDYLASGAFLKASFNF